MAAFRRLDLSRNFYFSYTYDVTSTLQQNLTRPPSPVPSDQSTRSEPWRFNDRYAWNHHMLVDAFGQSGDATKSHWVLPLIYGHVDQASTCILSAVPKIYPLTCPRAQCPRPCHLRYFDSPKVSSFCWCQVPQTRSERRGRSRLKSVCWSDLHHDSFSRVTLQMR
jgi:SacI homology domain